MKLDMIARPRDFHSPEVRDLPEFVSSIISDDGRRANRCVPLFPLIFSHMREFHAFVHPFT